MRRFKKNSGEQSGRRFRKDNREENEVKGNPTALTQSRVLDYLEERFGLDKSLFKDYSFYLGVKERLYLGPRSDQADMNGMRVATIGLMVARADENIKPTTNLLQVFGKKITKSVIPLTCPKAIRFVSGEDLILERSEIGPVIDGYVLLKYLNSPLGCGHLKDGSVKNMLPKAKRMKLKFI